MLFLLVGAVFGIAIGYFATQNTTPVTIRVAEYALEQVPLYLVIVGSLFVGLFISWILYFARSVSSRVTIYGRDHAVRKARQTAANLELRVQELEAENAHLKMNHSSPLEFPNRTLS
jgi:uncharacterized integral membrane protein